jgi:L-alanine-DL-glutamate epimerase-like enolase superfamily enzyme
MKITKFHTQIIRTPADEALAGGPVTPGTTRDFVILKMQTDSGVEGIGYTFFGAALTGALKAAVDAFAGLAVGEDPLRTEAIHTKLRTAALGSGPGGIQTLALSAIDIALWDIRGKALNLPVWQLLGGHRERVPTYASGALMRTFPLEHLVKAAPRLVEKGFRQMKTQLALPGETSPAIEVDRIRKVRESIGPDIDLMCDINQRWRVEQAIDTCVSSGLKMSPPPTTTRDSPA